MRDPLWPHVLTALIYFGSLAAIGGLWWQLGNHFIYGVGAGFWFMVMWYRLKHGTWPDPEISAAPQAPAPPP